MNKKIITGLIIAVVVIAVIVIVAVGTGGNSSKSESTQIPAESDTVQDNTLSTTLTTVPESSQEATQSTTSTTRLTAVNGKYDIKDGYYYYFDDKKTVCYAFSFLDGNKVKTAVFTDENITGEDPQYFESTFKYEIDNDEINIKPEGKYSFAEIKIDLDKLEMDGVELEYHKDLKLDYAVQHFNR